MFVTSQVALIDQLDAVKGAVLDAAGPIHSTVKLAQGAFAPVPTSDPTTFTEATFDGYAAKTITAWTSAYLVPGPSSEILSAAVLSWSPTGTTTPNTITGYWIVGGNGHYLGGESFAQPVILNGPLTALNLAAVWQVSRSTFSAQPLG
jgi:hypothetical protein